MTKKPIILVCGEPFSIFSELFLKLYKKNYFNNLKLPIVLIGSKKLIEQQAKKFKVNFNINSINKKDILKKKKIKKN